VINSDMIDIADSSQFSTLEAAQKSIEQLERCFNAGDGAAGWKLSMIYSPSNVIIPETVKAQLPSSQERETKYLSEAFPVLLKNAAEGDGNAMHLIGIYYQCGSPVTPVDIDACRDWNERSYAAGFLFAGNDLYTLYIQNKDSKYYNPERAKEILSVLNKHDLRCVPE
jgi:hypothetical protein